ncbi:uncharacterized protein N7482_004629 [Penicillium canariense]|uniref:EDC4-like protein pdc1 beta-propeller domain-containing protein n=1 Tax=Penicillium canariense TaxID=189055 RepID=A0A9W9I6Y5_9EURO|nr:uncharacterized protein N7482_004629 [Penicillium canariense]KAJ5169035.1 hypothetical protein N7482_004629 [Penicillium canariense]
MSTPNDLQALLASIRPRPSPSNVPGQENPHHQRPQQPYHSGLFPPHPQQQQPYNGQSFPHSQPHGYHHPSVTSAIQSPSPVHTPPHHGSDILSPNVSTPRPDWQQPQQPYPSQPPPRQQGNQDSAASLLNLLRFSQGPVAAPQPAPAVAPEQPRSPLVQEPASSHGRNISASDLVASFLGQKAVPTESPAVPAVAPAPVPSVQPEGPSENTQDMLLRLLNRSQPGPGVVEAPALVPTTKSIPPQQASNGPTEQRNNTLLTEVVDANPGGPAKPETVASPSSKESMFTYINPFDQLAAISPGNKSPQPKSDNESPAVELTKEKINVAADVEVPAAPDIVRLPKRSKSPVLEPGQREAVNDVVGRLVGEIGRSLSGSEPQQPTLEEEIPSPAPKAEEPEAFLSSIASHLRDTISKAQEVAAEAAMSQPVNPNTELGKGKQTGTDTAPIPAGESGNENTDALADSWESAEDSAEKDEERVVSVHNFPLRPFISITVKPSAAKLVDFRDDGIMDIARLKKDFDQLDRSLTAATSDYIVYALAKTGGIRIIRQDDGSDRQVFRSTRDRVFNVTLCTTHAADGQSDVQAILGIGVSGAVYWALISRAEKDLFEQDALESESLIFPPFPASDENTSGGQLKTRAKRSSRHPDLFAIGRGKNIYVIPPQAAMSATYGVAASQRTVNTEKFFKERALKISTGKAGKDFAFSDDDTVIASLDKTGRLRFWDISDILDNPAFLDGPAPTEVRVPLNTFVTGSPAEKSWPTSVLFLDKLRAYSRSMALRYVLVGLKQNHTLQLWDIGLGKAVEELKFPHENESDAICSVAYHPASGIIVIGHPTRNSIYFVHLSAPRYNLPVMSQAAFVKAATDKDSTLPKPESTACLSGIREISLGSKGQLRSLELLPITKSATDKRGTEETGLFELYVMHSRGVTCLNIKKEDLGWTDDNKVVRAIDGLEAGSIEISELQTFPSYVTDDPSVNGDAASTPSRTAKEAVKKTDLVESTAGVVPSRNASPAKAPAKKKLVDDQAEAPNGAEKADKKKKKKPSTAASETTVKAREPTATVGVEPLPTSDKPTRESEILTPSAAPMHAIHPVQRVVPSISDEALNKHLESLQSSVSNEFNKSLGREFESLYRRFDDERRSWDAASSAKQDQVLRLVSSTLSDNVEKNLTRIVSNSIQTEVVPAISNTTSAAVGKQISAAISEQLGSALSDELRQALPKAVTTALQQPAVMKAVSDSVAQKLSPRLDAVVQGAIAPLVENATRSTQKVEADLDRFFRSQMKHYEAQRQSDHAKIDEMSAVLRDLSSKVVSLSVHMPAKTAPSDAEKDAIMKLFFEEGKYEAASLKWIESSRQADLFDLLFVRIDPEYMTKLNVMLNLSVAVAVTVSLETNIARRLKWLETVLTSVDPEAHQNTGLGMSLVMNEDLRQVVPITMDKLGQRLHGLYVTAMQDNQQHPSPQKQELASRAVRLMHFTRKLHGDYSRAA